MRQLKRRTRMPLQRSPKTARIVHLAMSEVHAVAIVTIVAKIVAKIAANAVKQLVSKHRAKAMPMRQQHQSPRPR